MLPTLAAGSVDIVITSPPYNLGIGYCHYRDRLPEQHYLAFMVDVAREIRRVLRPDGSFFLNLSGSSQEPWVPLELAIRLRPLFALQNRIAWVKSITTDLGSTGQFKLCNSDQFLTRTTEDLFHFTLDGKVKLDRLAVGVEYADKSNLARHNKSQKDLSVPKPDRRDRGNCWFIPYQTVQSQAEKFDHPAGFPEDIAQIVHPAARQARRACARSLHGGTGTTLVAAAQEGCKGIGIELDPAYVATAERRLGAIMETVETVIGEPVAPGVTRHKNRLPKPPIRQNLSHLGTNGRSSAAKMRWDILQAGHHSSPARIDPRTQ